MSAASDRPPPERVTAWFPADPASIAAAREYVGSQLDRWGLTAESGVVSLVVSELATNAVRHARSGFGLDLSRADGAVRVAVGDESAVPPVIRERKPHAESGLGLRIVATLASDWGFDLREGGKQVWAHVAASVARPGPPSVSSDIPPSGPGVLGMRRASRSVHERAGPCSEDPVP
ncbi:MAG TPA: ATP-binding protein [Acidimicrobiales bacterium]|nr:ATP-binding protein [Acidimicrobiales bacterium]